MTLTLLELRGLARSPILWLGVVLVTAGAMPDILAFWPMLEGNDLIAHDLSLWFMAFAALAAGWLGLRDRHTGATALVGVTPADGKATVVPARVGALVVASFTGFAIVFGATLVVTAIRGGHGTPDLRLYLDGALLVALGGSIGYGLGYLIGSRIVCLLGAAALPALNQLLLGVAWGHPQEAPTADWAWLLPSVYEPERSVTFGFVPDIWSGHVAWLGALVVLVCGGITLIDGRRAASRRALIASIAVLVLGGLLAASSAAWLRSQPLGVVVLGPDTMHEIHDGDDYDYRNLTRRARANGPWPHDGRASECVSRYGFEACVFPEFGEDFARELAAAYGRQARLLRGLDAIPSRARMVPALLGPDHCARGALLLQEFRNPPQIQAYDNPLSYCAWLRFNHDSWDARAAVTTWLYAESHPDMRAELESGRFMFGSPAVTRAGLAMADMSPEDVRILLASVWDELRRGTLSLSELPGAQR